MEFYVKKKIFVIIQILSKQLCMLKCILAAALVQINSYFEMRIYFKVVHGVELIVGLNIYCMFVVAEHWPPYFAIFKALALTFYFGALCFDTGFEVLSGKEIFIRQKNTINWIQDSFTHKVKCPFNKCAWRSRYSWQVAFFPVIFNFALYIWVAVW